MIKVPSKKKFEFEIEEVGVIQMRRPTNGEAEEYSNAWESAKTSKEKKDALKEYLEVLGLKKEIFSKLEDEQIQFIISEITDTSKKN